MAPSNRRPRRGSCRIGGLPLLRGRRWLPSLLLLALLTPAAGLQASGSKAHAADAAAGRSILLAQASLNPLAIQAQQAFNSGNINAAIALWSQLINSGQEVQDSLYNRAQAFLVLRQFPLALNDLNQLEEMQRPSVRSMTFLLRGIVFNEMQNYAAALRDYNLAQKIDNNRLVYANRAVTYQRTGQFAKAETDLLQAIRTDPSQSNIHNLAAIQLSLNKYAECAANATRALASNKTFYPAYTVRGICLYNLGRLEPAVADFLRTTTLNPAQADASHYLGLSLIALGKPDQARNLLLRAADLYLSQNDQVRYQEVMKILSSNLSAPAPRPAATTGQPSRPARPRAQISPALTPPPAPLPPPRR